MATIGVAITTFQSARVIEDCLKSVRWADEVIVVDGGSTDGTLEIVRKSANKVFERPNHPIPEVNKNFAIERVESDWVMIVDSDERVSGELAAEVRRAVSSCPGWVTGFWLPRRNIIFGRAFKGGSWYPDWQLRLVRRGKGRFPCNDVHEYLSVDDRTAKLRGEIIHIGPASLSEYLRKMNHYSAVRAGRYVREGRRFSLVKMVLGPLRLFVTNFIVKGAYRDGVEGFLASICYSFNSFLDHAKFWERSSSGDRS